MAYLTNPIPVLQSINKPPTEYATLIVSNQQTADFFKDKYLQRSGDRNQVLVYGGIATAGGQYIPTTAHRGKALTLRVGAAYKAHRNTKWDFPARNIYDYRLGAFRSDIYLSRPDCIPLNPYSDEASTATCTAIAAPQLVEKSSGVLLQLQNFIAKHGEVTLSSQVRNYNEDGSVNQLMLVLNVGNNSTK